MRIKTVWERGEAEVIILIASSVRASRIMGEGCQYSPVICLVINC